MVRLNNFQVCLNLTGVPSLNREIIATHRKMIILAVNWWITLAMWLIIYSQKNAYRLVCYNERHDCWGKHFFAAGKNYRYDYQIYDKIDVKIEWQSIISFEPTFLDDTFDTPIVQQYIIPISVSVVIALHLSRRHLKPASGSTGVHKWKNNTLILSAVLCVISLHIYFVGPLSNSQVFTRQTNRHTDIYVDIRTLTCL